VIASLTGVVRAATRDVLVVDVTGVGYAVTVTPAVAQAHDIGDPIDILTSLIVREDSMTLFGFLSQQEQTLFDSLLTVSGVGPKSALGVLSALSPAEIFTAVSQEDDAVFKAVTGIGPKTAKLIVVQLSGRLSAVVSDDSTPVVSQAASSVSAQVITALVGLGWAEKTAREAVSEVGASEHSSVSDLLKATLASLAQVQRP
jgi:Holliday junction DNA helicase RuvA